MVIDAFEHKSDLHNTLRAEFSMLKMPTMRRHEPDPSIRNILITGGAGFIASAVVRQLVSLYPEYKVVNFDILNYCSSTKSVEDLETRPNYIFIKGDITSADFVNYVLKEHNIDTIFHFAAQTHVDNSFGDSFEFTKNNILGTHVLLEAARCFQVKRFIHVSTDEVYGEVDSGNPKCGEDSVLAPSNPYSATKAAAECLAQAYHKSFSVPIIVTRSNNVYGPRQYPEKIIPKFICSLLAGQKCCIHGDGGNSRHYLYVSDVADAMIMILHKGVVGESYNIGSDFEITNLQLARYLLIKFGLVKTPIASSGIKGNRPHPVLSTALENEEEYLEFTEDRPFNDKRYAIDTTKLEKFGWRPTVSFEDGIEKTIAWYRENGSMWWGEISSAFVAHPKKKMT